MSSEAIRRHYARLFSAAAGWQDTQLEDIVAATPRENFVGPGPWIISQNGRRIATPSDDLAFLYTNNLVALDEARNNGEPFLHAAWIGKVKPVPGEIVTHIGAGTGYYTAILSQMVLPRGEVFAFEIETDLAERALANLQPYENVTLGHADAVKAELPPSDIIYVNAGVTAPPVHWLKALKVGGRLIFPWRPSEEVGLAVIVTNTGNGLAFQPFMNSWFIPCVGASIGNASFLIPRDGGSARKSRSIWVTAERQPDDSATAILGDVWLSSIRVAGR